MELIEYLSGVCNKNIYPVNFPPTLGVPKDLAKKLGKLYKYGEKLGHEHGQSFTLDPNPPGALAFSTRVEGMSNSCDPPRTGDPMEFGDMHSHPSRSIGHVDGYSAHSLEDYFVFKHHLNKPVFIRFVSSGPWLYAVVYRQGLTRYDAAAINALLDKHTQAMWEYFEMMNQGHDYADFDSRKDKLSDIALTRSPQAADQQMVTWKVLTPGLGKWLMETSIRYNIQLAEIDRYGFYSAKNGEPLRLQAGPKGLDL
jgi:hypothetical protein